MVSAYDTGIRAQKKLRSELLKQKRIKRMIAENKRLARQLHPSRRSKVLSALDKAYRETKRYEKKTRRKRRKTLGF